LAWLLLLQVEAAVLVEGDLAEAVAQEGLLMHSVADRAEINTGMKCRNECGNDNVNLATETA
jgi:hypothetical protein